MKMVEIPAGEFLMGSDGEEAEYDEKPVHKVVITNPFRMGATEVTNAQYEQFRPEHKALRGKNGVSKADEDAVVNVSWQDAVDFCNWLSLKEGRSYRLPTEAEWEYACRAGTQTPYNTGDKLPHSMLRNQKIVRDYKAVSLKVGRTAPNAFGLCDMHGNVEEWCLDWYGLYSNEEQCDPNGPQNGEYRITRGGSHNTPVKYLRSSTRMAMIPEDKHSLTGFRVVESDWKPDIGEPSASTEKLSSPENSTENSETEDISKAAGTADNETSGSEPAEDPWAIKYDDEAIFLRPRPFISRPKDPAVPFYPHNHQPSITWCDNGDLLAVWFSTNAENGREMVILSSRLKKGAERWEEPKLFFKVPGRNMTGTSIFNDGKGTLYHLNGVEAAGDWQNLIMILRTSTDNGHTWTAPRIIAPEHKIRHQVLPGTLQMPNGWLVEACDAGPTSDDGTAIHITKSGGQTWDDPSDGSPLPKKIVAGGKGACI
ncbi:MAG: SUMF1/EgtB/PvdO family nonheme iron enzyme, partial [Bacteroidales bacterium]|nr:SUMF1/EgtB/PvdO family nonheme iron enzyme [Bacteroidales bacterium]